jgi:hypothetical protein
MLLRAMRGTPLVVSFPKSGRTWLRIMLDELGVAAEYTHFGAGVARALSVRELAPNPLWCAGRPTLLLVRDPRDTVVSAYYQATRRRNVYAGDLSSFVRDERFGIEKVARWNLRWAELACVHSGIAMLSYETLRREGVSLLAEVARFLRAKPHDDVLRAAWNAGSFESMQQRERARAFAPRYGAAFRLRDTEDENAYKVRRGVVGGYRDELGGSDVEFCDAVLRNLAYLRRIEVALSLRGLRPPS